MLQVTLRSGHVGLLKTLPAFGGAARQFLKTSSVAYRNALNPVGLGISLGSALYEAGRFSRAALRRMGARLSGGARLSDGVAAFRMPQRVNGRIGYPLSGRGAVGTSVSTDSTVHLTSHYDYRALKSWATGDQAEQADLKRLAVKRVTPGRPVLDPQRLRNIKDAIENGNYLPPLDVRRMGEGFEVINGNHRLQAAVELGLENVPVVIRSQPSAPLEPVTESIAVHGPGPQRSRLRP